MLFLIISYRHSPDLLNRISSQASVPENIIYVDSKPLNINLFVRLKR